MQTIFDVSLDDKKLSWHAPENTSSKYSIRAKATSAPRDFETARALEANEAANSTPTTCDLRLQHLRQHATNHIAICATLTVLVMLQLLFMHYNMQIIASTYTVVLCPLVLVVYVRTPLTQIHVVLLHYISVYVLLAHYEQQRDTSWLLSCWAVGVFTHLAFTRLHESRDKVSSNRPHTVLAACFGLVVVNATGLGLRLALFTQHTDGNTSEHQHARHVSHLAHGALLLLNTAAYAWLR